MVLSLYNFIRFLFLDKISSSINSSETCFTKFKNIVAPPRLLLHYTIIKIVLKFTIGQNNIIIKIIMSLENP